MNRPDMVTVLEAKDILRELGFNIKHAADWKYKFQNIRASARERDFECLLTFRQYMKLVKHAGITLPTQIGRALGNYQMGRKRDRGNYEWGNCRFITAEQNAAERVLNGGSVVASLKNAEKKRGRTKENDPSVARQAMKMTGRTKKSHVGIAIGGIKRSKSFVVYSPAGKKFTGLNISEFAEAKGLNPGAMRGVCAGTREHHKSWTGHYK